LGFVTPTPKPKVLRPRSAGVPEALLDAPAFLSGLLRETLGRQPEYAFPFWSPSMKRVLAVLMFATILLVFTACSGSFGPGKGPNDPNTPNPAGPGADTDAPPFWDFISLARRGPVFDHFFNPPIRDQP
jgi:hypothetical protein